MIARGGGAVEGASYRARPRFIDRAWAFAPFSPLFLKRGSVTSHAALRAPSIPLLPLPSKSSATRRRFAPSRRLRASPVPPLLRSPRWPRGDLFARAEHACAPESGTVEKHEDRKHLPERTCSLRLVTLISHEDVRAMARGEKVSTDRTSELTNLRKRGFASRLTKPYSVIG